MTTLQISLPRDPTSPAGARRQLRAFATRHEIDDPETALLVLSELVTNAVLHGEGEIEVCVSCDDRRVRIEVTDANPDTSVVGARERTPDRPGGWGLRIVESLAPRWGADRHDDGKTVWVEIDRAAPESGRASEATG